MPTVTGRSGYFSLNASNLSTYLDDVSFQRMKDLIDSHTFGDSSKEFTEGLRDARLTVAGNYDSTLASLSDVLNTSYTTAAGVAFELGPNGNTAGNEKFSGTAHVNDYSLKQGVGTIVKFSASLQVTGALTRGTY